MTSQKTTGSTSEKTSGFTIEELCRASGVVGEQVNLYREQGLLPSPLEVADGICYYDESCVNLLKLINNFHVKYELPLSMMKQVIDEVGHEQAYLIGNELEDKLNQAKQISWFETIGDINLEAALLTREELIEAADIPPEELDEAISQNLITSDEQGRFNQKDLEVATILAEINKKNGGNSEVLASLLKMRLKMTQVLVEEEFNVFLKNILNNNISVEDANELAMKSFDLLVDLFPKCYWQLLNKKIKHLLTT
ncbi:MAG: MerR family transcriptional regulator [Desulfosudaceae bacterium]